MSSPLPTYKIASLRQDLLSEPVETVYTTLRHIKTKKQVGNDGLDPVTVSALRMSHSYHETFMQCDCTTSPFSHYMNLITNKNRPWKLDVLPFGTNTTRITLKIVGENLRTGRIFAVQLQVQSDDTNISYKEGYMGVDEGFERSMSLVCGRPLSDAEPLYVTVKYKKYK